MAMFTYCSRCGKTKGEHHAWTALVDGEAPQPAPQDGDVAAFDAWLIAHISTRPNWVMIGEIHASLHAAWDAATARAETEAQRIDVGWKAEVASLREQNTADRERSEALQDTAMWVVKNFREWCDAPGWGGKPFETLSATVDELDRALARTEEAAAQHEIDKTEVLAYAELLDEITKAVGGENYVEAARLVKQSTAQAEAREAALRAVVEDGLLVLDPNEETMWAKSARGALARTEEAEG